MTLNELQEITIEDIESHKDISLCEQKKDLVRVRDTDITVNINQVQNFNNFAGNNFLYHHQLRNLLKCKNSKGINFYDIWNDDTKRVQLLEQTLQRNRGGKSLASNIYECYRINYGSIVMFKSMTAKYLYQKYSAKVVLDPTMGWGGRMLGAWALGINYIGIDNNVNLKHSYDNMLQVLENTTYFSNPLLVVDDSNITLLYDDCLKVDFDFEYDFVLTSPPYINLELYENMTPYTSKENFYKDFFLPLFDKCIMGMNKGYVCFNISKKMYDDALKYGLPPCTLEEDLLQQMGKNKKVDKIYVWQIK